MTAPKITDEMRQALAMRPAGPIPIEDDQTQSFYVLLTKDDYCRLRDDHRRRELQVTFDQVDRDEVSELDMPGLLAERIGAMQRDNRTQRDALAKTFNAEQDLLGAWEYIAPSSLTAAYHF